MLIDGDNAQPNLIRHVLAETAKYGNVTTRRIYGDWTTPQMSGWKDSLHAHAIQPIQQFRYTVGKNSTDSALIIDAMDLLHVGTVNGFCIVSSDSDYTRLATRVREQGLFVMGVGRSDTPRSFVNACEIFVYTENLTVPPERKAPAREAEGARKPETTDASPQNEQETPVKVVADWTEMIAQAIEMSTHDDGWAFLGAVGNHVRQLDPAFDPRNYGEKQMAPLVRSRPDLFEVRESKTESGPSLIYVKAKPDSTEAQEVE